MRVLELAEVGPPLHVDAGSVLAIEPVAACLIASALRQAARNKKQVVFDRMPLRLRQLFEKMECPVIWGQEPTVQRHSAVPRAPTLGLKVRNSREADKIANELAEHIASFVPSELRPALMEDEYGRQYYHAVQPALAYFLTELLDNVFSHACTVDFPEPAAWVAAQYYPTGDLMRVAVVDDGCGLLGSLRGFVDGPPKNHFEAAEKAFTAFLSSKSNPGIYADRRHMGMGLVVCRDMCLKMGGRIYSASGNAQVVNPGTDDVRRNQMPYYQGTIISLEFHRQAATSRTLSEALAKYTRRSTVDVRFK